MYTCVDMPRAPSCARILTLVLHVRSSLRLPLCPHPPARAHLAEGMVLDHVAQQAHKAGMRRELLDELQHSKKAHANSLPYDCFRPCVD